MDSEPVRAALVAGATRSMGIAIAHRLVSDGLAVMGCGRSVDGGCAAATAIDPTGRRARFVAGDVTDADQIDAAVEATIETFGRLDVVVNKRRGGPVCPRGP